ncbi:MAG: type II toxin-antitoxin system VapC family toxin [Planctomycetota bacterium]
MSSLVIDASMAVACCVGEPEVASVADAVLEELQGGQALVPAIWPAEVANALLVKERRGHLQPADTQALFTYLGLLPVVVDEPRPAVVFSKVAELARVHGLTSYDASYLELA